MENINSVENNLGRRLYVFRKSKGMTQGDVAIKLKISVAYVSKIERGEGEPNIHLVEKIEEFLFDRKDDSVPGILTVKEIPVLGRISAGFPNIAAEEILEYISIPGTPENSFALVVKGASMEPTLRDGDYVLFVEDGTYKSNDVLIILDEFGDAMVKRLKVRGETKVLVSDNQAYPIVEPNEHYRIIGKVVNVWRNIKI